MCLKGFLQTVAPKSVPSFSCHVSLEGLALWRDYSFKAQLLPPLGGLCDCSADLGVPSGTWEGGKVRGLIWLALILLLFRSLAQVLDSRCLF